MKQAKTVQKKKNTQDLNNKKDNCTHRAYTVEMGKRTKINKKVQNKLQMKINQWTRHM